MDVSSSDAAAWTGPHRAGLAVDDAAPAHPQATAPAIPQVPPVAPPDRKSLPVHEAHARAGGTALTDRKVEVQCLPDPLVTQAIDRYGQQVAMVIASGVYLRDEQADMRVSALGAPVQALLRVHPQARSQDWLTPALQATATHHPAQREKALQQVLRPALSSTLGRAQFQASLASIARSLEGADAQARRATFAALVKLLVMPHRDPADALALLEVAHGFRTGIGYDDAALLVSAAMRRIPRRVMPDLLPVARAALALLDASNLVAADQEPVVNLGIELGRQARSALASDSLPPLLEAVQAVAPGLRPEQLRELARGVLAGLGGTQGEAAARDAWLAIAPRLEAVLPLPAQLAFWEGTALGLLVDGAPGVGDSAGFSAAMAVRVQRSTHMGALVAAALARSDQPLQASALMSAAAMASDKRNEGPGTLDDLLQQLGAIQSRLPPATAFTVGCGLAAACWMLKDGEQAWAHAHALARQGRAAPADAKGMKDSKQDGKKDASGAPALDFVGLGWRFAGAPDTLAGPGVLPADLQAQLVSLAWSFPGIAGGRAMPRHLRWLSLAPLAPAGRVTLAVQLLAGLDGLALRQVFPAARDLLLQACAEADAATKPKTGPRPVLLQAMNELMLAYDRWLTEPDPLDLRTARAHQEEVAARQDLMPGLRLMILDRLAVHLSDTKAGPRQPAD